MVCGRENICVIKVKVPVLVYSVRKRVPFPGLSYQCRCIGDCCSSVSVDQFLPLACSLCRRKEDIPSDSDCMCVMQFETQWRIHKGIVVFVLMGMKDEFDWM